MLIKSYIGWEDYLGLAIFVIGLVGEYTNLLPWIKEISPELIGIGITVLIIDNANESIKRREEKKRLILQMGSPDNAFVREAVRQLRERGWLMDGSLSKANLHRANLSGADLSNAVMIGVNLEGAELEGCDLTQADLSAANLLKAILRQADLSDANLEGARMEYADLANALLWGANLRSANLRGADVSDDQLVVEPVMNDNTTLPDGSRYKTPEKRTEGTG
jgi:hypothetical protein